MLKGEGREQGGERESICMCVCVEVFEICRVLCKWMPNVHHDVH